MVVEGLSLETCLKYNRFWYIFSNGSLAGFGDFFYIFKFGYNTHETIVRGSRGCSSIPHLFLLAYFFTLSSTYIACFPRCSAQKDDLKLSPENEVFQ